MKNSVFIIMMVLSSTCYELYGNHSVNPEFPDSLSASGGHLYLMSDEAFLDWKKTAFPLDDLSDNYT